MFCESKKFMFWFLQNTAIRNKRTIMAVAFATNLLQLCLALIEDTVSMAVFSVAQNMGMVIRCENHSETC